jgi:hypothetical protein
MLGKQGGFTMDKDETAKKQLQKAPMLNSLDIIAILTCWGGAALVTYLSADAFVAMISIAAAYYLAKWVILKVEN